MDLRFRIYDLRLTTSVEEGRGLQAASLCAISRDVSVRLYPRVCATWKRRKRRAPSASVETTSKTYLPVGEGQGEGNRLAAQTATRRVPATSNLSRPWTEPRDSCALV